MQPDLWRELDRAARRGVPACGAIMTMILLALPGILPFQPALRASIVVISVFFWSLYRPASLPAPVILLIGLLLGLLGGSPLGLWAVLLLLEHGAVLRLRRRLMAWSFSRVWLIFTIMSLGIGAMQWLARCLLALTALPVSPIALETCAMVLLYPLVASLLARMHHGMAAPELA